MFRLLKRLIPAASIVLLLMDAALLGGAYFLMLRVTIPTGFQVYTVYEGGAARVATAVFCFVLALHFLDLYSQLAVRSRIALVCQVASAAGIAFMAQALIAYLKLDLRLPFRVMLFGTALAGAAILCGRIVFAKYMSSALGRKGMLLVGDSPLLEEIGDHVAHHPEMGLRVIGYVRDTEADEELLGGKILGPLRSLGEIVAATSPSLIAVGMAERRNRIPMAVLLQLRLSGYPLEEAPLVFEKIFHRISIRELRPSYLIYSSELGPHKGSYQRTWNFALAALGLILAAPLMALTAVFVRLSSPGPALYTQQRVGLNNRLFTLYKFRSMKVDAENETGPVWASKDDSRITRFGGFLRTLRIDELPQLFNVLKGDMAVVGPRPERPTFVRELALRIPYYPQRHFVRPGITGWAQISYKYGDTVKDAEAKLEYDLYYIKNMSFSFDFFIVLQTVKTMLKGRGSQ